MKSSSCCSVRRQTSAELFTTPGEEAQSPETVVPVHRRWVVVFELLSGREEEEEDDEKDDKDEEEERRAEAIFLRAMALPLKGWKRDAKERPVKAATSLLARGVPPTRMYGGNVRRSQERRVRHEGGGDAMGRGGKEIQADEAEAIQEEEEGGLERAAAEAEGVEEEEEGR